MNLGLNFKFMLLNCDSIMFGYLNGQCEINSNIYNNIDFTTIWYPLSVGNGQKDDN